MSTISLYPVVANGNSYNAASFATLGYVTALPAAITDVIAQAAKLFTSTSSTSATIANSGTISITVGTGLAFTTGQYVLCSAQSSPQTNFMAGTVTSYVTGSGALQFTANASSGSGTFTAWYINSCSYNNSLGLGQTNYGIVTSVLGTDQGSLGCPLALTTGNAYYDSQRPSSFLGLESPYTSMIEIFEEFMSVGMQSSTAYYTLMPQIVGGLGLPWYSVTAASPPQSNGKQLFLIAPGQNSSTAPCLVMFGNTAGYFHIGKGAVIIEFNILAIQYVVGLQYTFGLTACGSVNPVINIFGNGGIGFNISPTGLIECVVSCAGIVTKVASSYQLSASVQTYYRCRVEINHTGTIANYYINDVLITSITSANSNIVGLTSGTQNLMALAMEARNDINSLALNAPACKSRIICVISISGCLL